MSRLLDDLDARFRPYAVLFLARLVEAGIPIMLVQTRRTAAEQAEYLAKGTSWVQHSKHQDGLAMDVCPWDVWQAEGPDKLGWDEKNPSWPKIGKIAQKYGLKWGVVIDGKRKDLGHVEYVVHNVVNKEQSA